jgi:hypothetical protein
VVGDMDGTRPCGCNTPSPFQLSKSALAMQDKETDDLSYKNTNNDKGPGSSLD